MFIGTEIRVLIKSALGSQGRLQRDRDTCVDTEEQDESGEMVCGEWLGLGLGGL